MPAVIVGRRPHQLADDTLCRWMGGGIGGFSWCSRRGRSRRGQSSTQETADFVQIFVLKASMLQDCIDAR